MIYTKKAAFIIFFIFSGINFQSNVIAGKILRLSGHTLVTIAGVFAIKESYYNCQKCNHLKIDLLKKCNFDAWSHLGNNMILSVAGFYTTWMGVKGIVKEPFTASTKIKKKEQIKK